MIAAKVSLSLVVQKSGDGPFPSMTTYPADFERLLRDDAVKVFAAAGAIPPPPTPGTGSPPAFAVLAVSGTLARITHWFVENTSETGSITLSGGPFPGTLAPGQVLLATNENEGWPSASVMVGGPVGSTYKIIALGT